MADYFKPTGGQPDARSRGEGNGIVRPPARWSVKSSTAYVLYCTYRVSRFEWDERKNSTNLRKHGISFETARLVFDDPVHVSFIERVTGGESRWHTIGSVGGIAMLVVVHTYDEQGRSEVIRIISARKASKRERKLYAEALQNDT